jgi:hypothetical protein
MLSLRYEILILIVLTRDYGDRDVGDVEYVIYANAGD